MRPECTYGCSGPCSNKGRLVAKLSRAPRTALMKGWRPNCNVFVKDSAAVPFNICSTRPRQCGVPNPIIATPHGGMALLLVIHTMGSPCC